MELYKLYLSNPYLHSLEVYSSYGNTLFGNSPGNSRQIAINPTETQIENIRQNAQKTGLTGNRAWYVLSSDPEQTLFATYNALKEGLPPPRHRDPAEGSSGRTSPR